MMTLPIELMLHTCNHLDKPTLVSMSLTCKKMNEAIRNIWHLRIRMVTLEFSVEKLAQNHNISWPYFELSERIFSRSPVLTAEDIIKVFAKMSLQRPEMYPLEGSLDLITSHSLVSHPVIELFSTKGLTITEAVRRAEVLNDPVAKAWVYAGLAKKVPEKREEWKRASLPQFLESEASLPDDKLVVMSDAFDSVECAEKINALEIRANQLLKLSKSRSDSEAHDLFKIICNLNFPRSLLHLSLFIELARRKSPFFEQEVLKLSSLFELNRIARSIYKSEPEAALFIIRHASTLPLTADYFPMALLLVKLGKKEEAMSCVEPEFNSDNTLVWAWKQTIRIAIDPKLEISLDPLKAIIQKAKDVGMLMNFLPAIQNLALHRKDIEEALFTCHVVKNITTIDEIRVKLLVDTLVSINRLRAFDLCRPPHGNMADSLAMAFPEIAPWLYQQSFLQCNRPSPLFCLEKLLPEHKETLLKLAYLCVRPFYAEIDLLDVIDRI